MVHERRLALVEAFFSRAFFLHRAHGRSRFGGGGAVRRGGGGATRRGGAGGGARPVSLSGKGFIS
jgi:hypothetical protein